MLVHILRNSTNKTKTERLSHSMIYKKSLLHLHRPFAILNYLHNKAINTADNCHSHFLTTRLLMMALLDLPVDSQFLSTDLQKQKKLQDLHNKGSFLHAEKFLNFSNYRAGFINLGL